MKMVINYCQSWMTNGNHCMAFPYFSDVNVVSNLFVLRGNAKISIFVHVVFDLL